MVINNLANTKVGDNGVVTGPHSLREGFHTAILPLSVYWIQMWITTFIQ